MNEDTLKPAEYRSADPSVCPPSSAWPLCGFSGDLPDLSAAVSSVFPNELESSEGDIEADLQLLGDQEDPLFSEESAGKLNTGLSCQNHILEETLHMSGGIGSKQSSGGRSQMQPNIFNILQSTESAHGQCPSNVILKSKHDRDASVVTVQNVLAIPDNVITDAVFRELAKMEAADTEHSYAASSAPDNEASNYLVPEAETNANEGSNVGPNEIELVIAISDDESEENKNEAEAEEENIFAKLAASKKDVDESHMHEEPSDETPKVKDLDGGQDQSLKGEQKSGGEEPSRRRSPRKASSEAKDKLLATQIASSRIRRDSTTKNDQDNVPGKNESTLNDPIVINEEGNNDKTEEPVQKRQTRSTSQSNKHINLEKSKAEESANSDLKLTAVENLQEIAGDNKNQNTKEGRRQSGRNRKKKGDTVESSESQDSQIEDPGSSKEEGPSTRRRSKKQQPVEEVENPKQKKTGGNKDTEKGDKKGKGDTESKTKKSSVKVKKAEENAKKAKVKTDKSSSKNDQKTVKGKGSKKGKREEELLMLLLEHAKDDKYDSEEDESKEKEVIEVDENEESDVDAGEIEDEDDSDFDPEDDPDKLWCICKKPHGNRFMICCDKCEEWFHGDCVGISMQKGREMENKGEEWVCRKCSQKEEAKVKEEKEKQRSERQKLRGKLKEDEPSVEEKMSAEETPTVAKKKEKEEVKKEKVGQTKSKHEVTIQKSDTKEQQKSKLPESKAKSEQIDDKKIPQSAQSSQKEKLTEEKTPVKRERISTRKSTVQEKEMDTKEEKKSSPAKQLDKKKLSPAKQPDKKASVEDKNKEINKVSDAPGRKAKVEQKEEDVTVRTSKRISSLKQQKKAVVALEKILVPKEQSPAMKAGTKVEEVRVEKEETKSLGNNNEESSPERKLPEKKMQSSGEVRQKSSEQKDSFDKKKQVKVTNEKIEELSVKKPQTEKENERQKSLEGKDSQEQNVEKQQEQKKSESLDEEFRRKRIERQLSLGKKVKKEDMQVLKIEAEAEKKAASGKESVEKETKSGQKSLISFEKIQRRESLEEKDRKKAALKASVKKEPTEIKKESVDKKDHGLSKQQIEHLKSKEHKVIRRESLDKPSATKSFKRKPSYDLDEDVFPESSSDYVDEFPKRRKSQEPKFVIPKKVRTTPTPKVVKPLAPPRYCVHVDCKKLALKGAVYCSSDCIIKHANQSLHIMEEDKKRRLGTATTEVKSPTQTESGGKTISPATSTTDTPGDDADERIPVVEKSSGRIIAGVVAPTRGNLIEWLEDHPTFEVLKPAISEGHTTTSFYSTTSPGSTEAIKWHVTEAFLLEETLKLVIKAAPNSSKDKKSQQDEVVRNNVKKTLKETLLARCREIEFKIDLDEVIKKSNAIEEEMFKYFGDTGQKYRTKYRSLVFNLKDQKNKNLFKKVLHNDIPADKFVRMTPEQLASAELAKWREREAKHSIEMIKKREEEEAHMAQHHVKKTHKGEVEIDEDESLTTLEAKIEPVEDRKASAGAAEADAANVVLEDTTEQHNSHLFDLNCKICTGKQAPPGEHKPTPHVIQAIPESSVPSPTSSPEEENLQPSPPTMDSMTKSPSTPPPPLRKKEKPIWKGFIMMQNVAKFVTCAYHVSGPCDNLLQILPDTIHVCGRINHEQVWDYIFQLRGSASKIVDVIRFEMASDDEKAAYVELYSYFYTRKRIGVVGNCYSGVKDMYLVPLASHDPIPPELKPFDGPGFPIPRPHMLIGIIIKFKQASAPKRPKAFSEKFPSGEPETKKRKESKDKDKLAKPKQKKSSTSGEYEDIIFGQTKRSTSSSKSTTSSESSSIQTPDLGSPPATTPVAATPGSTSEGQTPTSGPTQKPVLSEEQSKAELKKLDEQKEQLIRIQQQIKEKVATRHAMEEAAKQLAQAVQTTVPLNVTTVANKDEKPEIKDTANPEDAPYDPEDEFVIDLIEDIPLPSATKKEMKPDLPMPHEIPKKPEIKMPELPPIRLPEIRTNKMTRTDQAVRETSIAQSKPQSTSSVISSTKSVAGPVVSLSLPVQSIFPYASLGGQPQPSYVLSPPPVRPSGAARPQVHKTEPVNAVSTADGRSNVISPTTIKGHPSFVSPTTVQAPTWGRGSHASITSPTNVPTSFTNQWNQQQQQPASEAVKTSEPLKSSVYQRQMSEPWRGEAADLKSQHQTFRRKSEEGVLKQPGVHRQRSSSYAESKQDYPDQDYTYKGYAGDQSYEPMDASQGETFGTQQDHTFGAPQDHTFGASYGQSKSFKQKQWRGQSKGKYSADSRNSAGGQAGQEYDPEAVWDTNQQEYGNYDTQAWENNQSWRNQNEGDWESQQYGSQEWGQNQYYEGNGNYGDQNYTYQQQTGRHYANFPRNQPNYGDNNSQQFSWRFGNNQRGQRGGGYQNNRGWGRNREGHGRGRGRGQKWR